MDAKRSEEQVKKYIPITFAEYYMHTKDDITCDVELFLAIHPSQVKWTIEWLRAVPQGIISDFGPCYDGMEREWQDRIVDVSGENIALYFPNPCTDYETHFMVLISKFIANSPQCMDKFQIQKKHSPFDKSMIIAKDKPKIQNKHSPIVKSTESAMMIAKDMVPTVRDMVPTVRFQVHAHGVAPRQGVKNQNVFMLSLPDHYVSPTTRHDNGRLVRTAIDLCVTAQCPPGYRMVVTSCWNANDGYGEQPVVTAAKDQRLYLVLTESCVDARYRAGEYAADLIMEKLEVDFRITHD